MIALAAPKPEWEVGFPDECGWSRVTTPAMHAWSEKQQALKLRDKAQELPKEEPKALACYGVWFARSEEMRLRFVEGRPVSAATEEFLEWVAGERYRQGKRAVFLVWDNASWHVSQRVRAWLRQHNRAVKRGEKAGARLVVCPLPSRSPWLNPIKPKWLHGKRAIAEPNAVLDEVELMARVYEHFACPVNPLLSTTVS